MMSSAETARRSSVRSGGSHPPVATSPRPTEIFFDPEALRAFARSLCTYPILLVHLIVQGVFVLPPCSYIPSLRISNERSHFSNLQRPGLRASPSPPFPAIVPQAHTGLGLNENQVASRKDMQLPRVLLRAQAKIVFESEHEVGGHFAAYEQPEALVSDLRTMFGKSGPAARGVPGCTGY
ncbi:hypothetical protein EDB84DRAFT_1124339 [Lactarius hengduanensis]|nr:hypothetical protein EDB84DRAFT_1124339 [Lactarius hengduanensis]